MKNPLILFVLLLSSLALAQSVQLDWAMNVGNAEDDEVRAVVHDSLGNVYLLGDFEGTVDFDHGPNTVNVTSAFSGGAINTYIVKLDANGNFLWVKAVLGNNATAEDMEIDSDGNLIILGNFFNTVDFDPGPNVFNMTTPGTGDFEGYVLKLDPNGNFIWAKKIRADFEKIAIDYQNNIAITGRYNGVIDFDPGSGTTFLSSGSFPEAFAVKLDNGGNFLWAGGYSGFPKDINFDLQGNLYSVGIFSQTGDFDPGSAVVLRTSNGDSDFYILKLDVNGSFVWVESIGGTNNDLVGSIDLDSNGNVYVAGNFSSLNLDFDNGSGTAIYSRSGNNDGFLLKLNSNGSFNWVKTFEGFGNFVPTIIKLDILKSAYIAGRCSGVNDFDPGPNTYNVIANQGDNHIFIVKLDSLGDFKWGHDFGNPTNQNLDHNIAFSLSIIGVDTLLMAGSYEDTIDFNPGPAVFNLPPKNSFAPDWEGFCLKLIPCGSDTITDTITSCDTYTWIDGNTYTSSNITATFNSVNQNGCDSIIALHLTILNSETRTDTRTECAGFTWINGTTYTSSNNTDTYNIPGAATNGCDSIISLNLNIINVNTTVTQQDQLTLASNASSSTYQWLDCDNNFAEISGMTSSTFTATSNGNYAVEVTFNGCTDTSNCNAITSVGLSEVDPFAQLSVFPNPTNGRVNISSEGSIEVSLKLYNALGQLILERKNIIPTGYQFNIEGEAGIYTLEVNVDGLVKQHKIVKE